MKRSRKSSDRSRAKRTRAPLASLRSTVLRTSPRRHFLGEVFLQLQSFLGSFAESVGEIRGLSPSSGQRFRDREFVPLAVSRRIFFGIDSCAQWAFASSVAVCSSEKAVKNGTQALRGRGPGKGYPGRSRANGAGGLGEPVAAEAAFLKPTPNRELKESF